jgi:hypothetical protein
VQHEAADWRCLAAAAVRLWYAIPECALFGADPESSSSAPFLDSGFARKTRTPE